jgi:hypothetical protein
MLYRSSIGAIALLAALSTADSGARAFDDTTYPDWKGQWVRIGGGGQYDPSKPPARGQEPPLTAEYRAIWEANLAEAAAGGQLYNTQVRCLPGGMPRMMMAYEPMEIIITPDITYVEISFNTGTIKPSSRSGCPWTRPIRTSCEMRSRPSTTH